MLKAEQEEIERRQRGTSSAVIPAAIPQQPASGYNSGGSGKKDYVAGAVSGTESESETEFISSLRGSRKKSQFKWTQEFEDILEELLIKHQFDFKVAAREFVKIINKDSPELFFTVDARQLQIRWTDIEIRKYRLPEQEAKQPERKKYEIEEEGTFNIKEQYGVNFDEQFAEMIGAPRSQSEERELPPQQPNHEATDRLPAGNAVREIQASEYNDLEELD